MPVMHHPVVVEPLKAFGAPPGQDSGRFPMGPRWPTLLFLLVLCSFLFFYGLGTGELYRTESLRALIAAEFLHSGNWVVPVLYGQPLFTKPPGMYAAIALVSWPIGEVREWTARLPSAVAALLTVLLFYSYFRRQVGALGGVVVAVVLPTSSLWLTFAPSAEIDMLQVTWVTLALLCFLRALEIAETRPAIGRGGTATRSYRVSAAGEVLEDVSVEPTVARRQRRGEWFWWLAALICVAGGFLTKWTAPAFFYGTVVPLLWWRGRLRLLGQRHHLVGLALAIGICLAWVTTAVALVGWSAFSDTVSREALLRLLPSAQQPYSWRKLALHPFLVLGANLPWSASALLALRPGFSQLWDPRGRRLLQALHCWVWPNLLFWSAVPERAIRHSFPLFPGIAGLAALVWLAWLTGRLRWPLARWSPTQVLVGTLAFWIAVKLAFVHVVVPLRNEVRQPRAKGHQLAACVPAGKTLYVIGLYNKDEGILFYYGRPVQRLQDSAHLPTRGGPVYVLLDEPEWRQQDWAQAADVLVPLRDEQGATIRLVRFPGGG